MDHDENDAVCEKIINEIDLVFQNDSDLCTFEIIHLAANQNKNKSPVIHAENNLGLESWCTQHVYEYAHKTIFNKKIENHKSIHCISIVKYLNCAILINPDVATFWNIRRKLFINNKLNITKEFKFSSIVLSKKPKSNEAFCYRRWLFSFQSAFATDWTYELGLCERCADKSSSNYPAWCHRNWVLNKSPFLLKYEPRITEKFIRKHIGDYSGFCHRQYVLYKMLETNIVDDQHESNNYDELFRFAGRITSKQIVTVDQLTNLLLPIGQTNHNDLEKKSFFYCMNIAAQDLDMCDELKAMYGYRESFQCHRRSVLKFIVESFRKFNFVKADSDPPQNKMVKIDGSACEFLDCLTASEGELGELHRKWCQIYLGFDYRNVNSFAVD